METERLTIRPFEMSDAPALQAILGDTQTMTYVETPYDLPKTEAFLRDFCIGQRGALAAVQRETGRLIGYLLFKAIEPGVYEIGWIIARDCWRQGYAFEASRALMCCAFEELGARKVVAETVDPVKAAGLMKKLGMRPEGIERGSGENLLLFGLQQAEFEQ